LKISSKNKKILIVGAVALLLIVSGYFLYQYTSKQFTKDSSISGNTTNNPSTSSTTAGNDVPTQDVAVKAAAPSIEISSPAKGATLSDGNSIKIKTNSTTAKVNITVSSDKWGTVYENTMYAKGEVAFTYAPEQTVPAGSSGNINVKLIDGTTIQAEQTLWVNF
jgi:hypothetical protein